jgi:ABC-2 type transport system ATP-binding protein
MPMLKILNLSKSYDSLKSVDDISLEVFKGEIFGFLGPNGAGKTTTISMISGLLKPDSGKIFIDSFYQAYELKNIKKIM